MAEPTLNADLAKGSGKDTYGQILSQAREGKGLSVDQVASQLRLAPKQIVGLEASDPSVFGSTVYTRAHVRSYARLLGVEEAKIMNVFNNSLSKEERDLQSFIRKTTYSLRPYREETTKNGKAKGLGWLLFLIVLGTVGWLGWNYLQNNFDVDELKAKVTSMVPMLSSSDEEKANEAGSSPEAVQTSAEGTQHSDSAVPSSDGAAQPADPNAPAQAANASQSGDPSSTTIGRTPEERALEEKVMAEQAQQQQAQQAAAAQAATPTAAQSTAPLQPTQGAQGFEVVMNVPSGEVTTKFSASEGECWFGIYQGGKLVSNATLRDGQSREFTNKLPFRITVGNHFRGKVDLDGRPVELSQGARSGSISFLVRAQ
ncbi:MAG: DUF4115 domain-containing protein [Burkholderiales bacterium]|nr:DUF4115 domain-containing protein [Burkholderiales bacterium]